MKKIVLFLLFFALTFTFGVHGARAAGLGFYGSFGGGTADWSPNSSGVYDFSKNTKHLGFGLVMDTAPASARLFNYQLNIGYDRFRNTNSNAWGDADLDSLVISNNFGFGGMLNSTTRLWFGPEIQIRWADGKPDRYSNFKIKLFGLGIGPVLGMNFNFSDSGTFAVKTGYQFIHYAGEGNGYFDHSAPNTVPLYSHNYNYDVTEKMFYVMLEFMIRTSRDGY
ncbi:MAG TPA: hypothetical protein VF903_12135 [Nitrospirota bacterium]